MPKKYCNVKNMTYRTICTIWPHMGTLLNVHTYVFTYVEKKTVEELSQKASLGKWDTGC